MTYYLYTLKDPVTSAVRWVGITTNPKNRLDAHIYIRKKVANEPKIIWIESLLSRGLKPTLEVISQFNTKSEAIQAEAALTQSLRATENLLNKNTGNTPSKETRALMSRPAPIGHIERIQKLLGHPVMDERGNSYPSQRQMAKAIGLTWGTFKSHVKSGKIRMVIQ
jgi:predicted GIY-YIG superfamily endonuclease